MSRRLAATPAAPPTAPDTAGEYDPRPAICNNIAVMTATHAARAAATATNSANLPLDGLPLLGLSSVFVARRPPVDRAME